VHVRRDTGRALERAEEAADRRRRERGHGDVEPPDGPEPFDPAAPGRSLLDPDEDAVEPNEPA
jgi:hypothetical protein